MGDQSYLEVRDQDQESPCVSSSLEARELESIVVHPESSQLVDINYNEVEFPTGDAFDQVVVPADPPHLSSSASSETGEVPESSRQVVVNDEVEYSFAYPEMLKQSFPWMFETMSMARVEVKVLQDVGYVYGKIAALITDGNRRSVYFRVGSLLFNPTESLDDESYKYSDALKLERSVIMMPSSGWLLHIKVDLHLEFYNPLTKKNLKHTFDFVNTNLNGSPHSVSKSPCGLVEVSIIWVDEQSQHQPQMISPTVEVRMMDMDRHRHLTVVYTIEDDAMSFTEFIMTLRRILADHPGREDILDGHDLLNLSSTRQHPVLPRISAAQPERWIHVKLQVKDKVVKGKQTMSWTTLVMRDDNVYVHGFINQHGAVYELKEDKRSSPNMLPQNEYHPIPLGRTVTYKSILGLRREDDTKLVVKELASEMLDKAFAVKAVRALSRYPDEPLDDIIPMKALAGLIVMVCESARMNPFLHSFAAGWTNSTGFNKLRELMNTYVWDRYWGNSSEELLYWKSQEYSYNEPDLTSEPLQAIHLVCNNGKYEAKASESEEGSSSSGGGHDSADDQQSTVDPDDPPPSDTDSQPGRPEEGSSSKAPAGNLGEKQGEEGPKGPQRTGPVAKAVHKSKGKGRGRRLVEVLAMRAKLGAIGEEIVVFDGKRGQIICRKEEQTQDAKQDGEKGMVDLVLTGPYTGISAEHGCFAIHIDIPEAPPFKWEWDWNKKTYAAQVDKPPVHHYIIGDVAEITYAVMSNALEATLQVMVQLKDGLDPRSAVDGEISARIGDFKDRSVLFSRATDQLVIDTSRPRFRVKLSRNVVAVPCGRELYIKVDLRIQVPDQEEKKLTAELEFANGVLYQLKEANADGDKVEVNVKWYPEVQHVPEVVYTIQDDGMSYAGFLMALRRILAEHPESEDVMDHHHDPNLSSSRQHPVLAKKQPKPARWIRVKLQALSEASRNKMCWATLLMRGDNLYVHGFINERGDVYELLDNNKHNVNIVPSERSPTGLQWGVKYRTILGVETRGEAQLMLHNKAVGKDYAVEAVNLLSGFSTQYEQGPYRQALAGLILMFCESARFKPICDTVERHWNDRSGTPITIKQITDYVWNWANISRALLRWKDGGYKEWIRDRQLGSIGIWTPKDALDVIHLVKNVRGQRAAEPSAK